MNSPFFSSPSVQQRAVHKADTADSNHSVTPVCRSPSLLSLLMNADLFEANAYSVRLVHLWVCVRTTLGLFVHLCEGF